MRGESEIEGGQKIAESLAHEILATTGMQAVLSWGPRELVGHSTKRLRKSAVRSVDPRFRTLSIEVGEKVATARLSEEWLAECDRAGPVGAETRGRVREVIAAAVAERFG